MSVPWYLMAKGKGGGGYKTVSGPIVSISDALAAPLRSLLVGIDPVQDLHGYASPWPAGGGINAMPPAVAKSETQNGVTVSTDGSGVYSISAVAEADTVIEFPLINSFVIPDGTSVDGTHSIMLKNTFASNGVTIYFYDGTTQLDSWVTSPTNRVAVNYSALANKTCDRIKVKVTSGTSVTGTFGIMFVPKGTASTTPFSPYSNICPISGWSAVNVWVKPTYDPTAEPTATIQLGQTVYGGTLDVINGVLTVDRVCRTYTTYEFFSTSPKLVRLASDSKPVGNSEVGNIIASYLPTTYVNNIWANTGISGVAGNPGEYIYARIAGLSTAEEYTDYLTTNPLQVCYELATPITIPLTPQEISTLQGTNNLWADTGDVTVEYLSSGGANADLMKLAVAFMGRR